MEPIYFNSGSKIESLKTNGNIRGNRSNFVSFYCQECKIIHVNVPWSKYMVFGENIAICKTSYENMLKPFSTKEIKTMVELRDKIRNKLIKFKRKFKPISYREVELFCKTCEKSLGNFDIVTTNLESYVYCDKCMVNFIKDVPNKSNEYFDIVQDFGNEVVIRYYKDIRVYDEVKICYFNQKGRYIKVKNKRYYI